MDDSPETRPPLRFRRAAIYVALLAAAVVASLFLTWQLRWALALTFAAVLVATFFHGGASLIQWASKHTIGRHFGHGSALALFCLLLLAAVAGFGMVAAPALSGQVDQLQEQLPTSVDALRTELSQTRWGQWIVDQGVLGQAERAVGDTGEVVRRGAAWLGSLVTVLTALVFLLFTGLYLAVEPGLYRRGLLWLVPPRDRRRADHAMGQVGRTLTFWLGGQLVSMTIVGLLSGLGLWALGVPLPFVLATITALLTFIPNFGPVASVVPPALLAFGIEGRIWSGPTLAGAVVALYLLIQTLESYLITPMIQKKAVELPPALLIFAQLVMGLLIGLVGVAVAAPLVAALMTASRELLVVGDVNREHPKDRAHPGGEPDESDST